MTYAAPAPPDPEQLRRVFGRYVDAPIWVAWALMPNSTPGKDPIKVPIDPVTGRAAKTNDPKTWAPMGRAMALAKSRNLAGVGIMLGPDPDQNPNGAHDRPFIVGVDYDGALQADGKLMPWAADLMVGDTYTEISPSGTGVKSFALVQSRPDGIPEDQDGVKLRLDGITAPPGVTKRPGIEVYTNRRWFAVTGRQYGGSSTLADVTARIPRLLQHARPSLAPVAPPVPGEPDDSFSAADAHRAHAAPLTGEQHAHLASLLHAHADLARAVTGDDWPDRSAALFAAADLCKGYRVSFEQFVHAVMAATGAAGSHVRDQPDPYRSLARAWDRSPQPLPMAPPPPVPDAPQIGDRPAQSSPAGYVTPFDISKLDEPNPLGAPQVLPLDLMSNPPPLPSFVLAGLFPAAPTAFVGTGGVLKSTIWMGLALHMILRKPVWGAHWRNEAAALLISKEDERAIILRRLYDMLHAMNVTERQYREIVSQRFFLDDWTESGARLVEADRAGNLHTTPVVDFLIDKYRGRHIGFAALDPMVNFGPGEVHGNDGAAHMMAIAWKLTRGWGDQAPCNVSYIHHLSMAAARDEIEDAHAGRSASAIGDNARSVWVLHRHKTENVHGHVAPSSIPADAIQAGNVIRLRMAKQSYARRVDEPFWVWREGHKLHFVEPMEASEAQRATAAMPSRTERARLDRENARRAAIMAHLSQTPAGATIAALVAATGFSPRIVREQIRALADEGAIHEPGAAHTYALRNATPASTSQYGF